eukprot:4293194-Amphidinium_carterae.1
MERRTREYLIKWENPTNRQITSNSKVFSNDARSLKMFTEPLISALRPLENDHRCQCCYSATHQTSQSFSPICGCRLDG